MAALPSFFNKRAILKQIPIFEGLNWFELNRISRQAGLVEFNKGDILCKQGDPADAFYVIVSGRVYSYALNPAGQKEEVDFLLRGMHFGVISTLTGENHSHTYEAINDSVVLKIEKTDFADLLKVTPRLAVALSQSLSRRIRSHVTHTKDSQESTIIAVYSPLKGSGSSTYAANIALSLKSQTHKKVLLLSLSSDPRDPLTNLSDIISDHDSIINAIIKDKTPVDLLYVKFDSGTPALVNRISQFVSAPANDYNYVVVDLPNEMDDVVMKTLTQSDVVHLVAMSREKDLEMTRGVIDHLSEALKDKFQPDKVQIIISGVQEKFELPPEEIKKLLNYDVFLFLPHLKPDEFNRLQVNEGISMIAADPSSEYGFKIRRLARQISGSLVGLALGGGAALGLAHIGVIKVLEQENITVDVVVGSSMGALLASLWAAGYDAQGLEKCGREFEKKSAILAKLYRPLVPMAGLMSGYGIVQWLKGKLRNQTFHHTRIPLKVVAYDLFHRQEILIDQGDLIEAVRRSITIPGVIPPVMEEDRMIIDGGVLNPLPTNVLVEMGVKKIIAVNVLQSPQEVSWGREQKKEEFKKRARVPFIKHPWHYLSFRLGNLLVKPFTPNIPDIIVRTLQASEYVIAEESGKQADVVIHPDLRGIQWFELYRVNDLIKAGEQAALKHLPAIKELMKK